MAYRKVYDLFTNDEKKMVWCKVEIITTQGQYHW